MTDMENDFNSTGQNDGGNIKLLLRRVELFLEDGEWDKADEYCEQVLDQDPENVQAYLGKLMAKAHAHRQEELPDAPQPFDGDASYQKLLRFAGDGLRETLVSCNESIKRRLEQERLESIYKSGVTDMYSAKSDLDFEEIAARLDKIAGYKDAAALASQCRAKAEQFRSDVESRKKDEIYDSAKKAMDKRKIKSYRAAIEIFKTIPGWRDADEQIKICRRKIKGVRRRRYLSVLGVFAVICLFFIISHAVSQAEERKIYSEAMEYLEDGDYDRAYGLLYTIDRDDVVEESMYERAVEYLDAGRLEDARDLVEACGNDDTVMDKMYERGMKCLDAGKFDEAYMLLEGSYHDRIVWESKYVRGKEYIDSGEYGLAYELLDELDYEDSEALAQELRNEHPGLAKIGETVQFGSYEQDNDLGNGSEPIEWEVLDIDGDFRLLFSVYSLDFQPYDTSSEMHIYWEMASIRGWLNNTFYYEAFNESDREHVSLASLPIDDNYNAKQRLSQVFLGNPTKDVVFLLSLNQVIKYDLDRGSQTPYCEAIIDEMKDSTSDKGWWTRTVGFNNWQVVIKGEGIDWLGIAVDENVYGEVRPAIWYYTGDSTTNTNIN